MPFADTVIRYFADENLLGMAKVLASRGRADLVQPGHPQVPEVPYGCPDTEWVPVVARHGWIVLTRDRKIRSHPAEARAVREHGLRLVLLGAKRDLTPTDAAELFERQEERLTRLAVRLGRGPWIVRLRPTSVYELHEHG
jgi:hypothetical protein